MELEAFINLRGCSILEDRESAKGSVVADDLYANSVVHDLPLLLKFVIVTLEMLGESKPLADSNSLSSRELHLCSSQGFLSSIHMLSLDSDGHEDGTNLHSSAFSNGLSEGMSHTSLESISSSTGKHLIDSEDVPRVNSHFHMESFLACVVGHVLVCSNSGSFQSLGGNLFLLSRNHMNAARVV